MDILKRQLTKISPPGLCVLIALSMIGIGLLTTGAFSFTGAAIAMIILAIYLRMPFSKPDDVVISLSTAYLLKELIRKPRTAREEQAVIELTNSFDKAMRS